MKTKDNKSFFFQSLLPAALLLISAGAYAASGGGQAGSGNDGLIRDDVSCNHCPRQPVSAELPGFDELEALYDQGVQPTPEQIQGSWKEVLKIGNPSLKGVEKNIGKNAEDETGIANLDGSLKSLMFSSKTDPWKNEQEIVVTLKGLGNKSSDQGPNEVNFQENSACFAQNGYGGSPGGYYFYKCRMVAHSTRLLCVLGFEKHDLSTISDDQKNWLGKVVAFTGYTRAR